MHPNPQSRFQRATIFLAALIAFQSAGWFLAWQGLQLGARFEAQRVLFGAHNELRESTFHKDFFEKGKVGKREIRLEGQLFDYKILSKNSDSVRVVLYHDQFEQSLLSALGRVLRPGGCFKAASTPLLVGWLAQCLCSVFLPAAECALLLHTELPFQKQNFTALLLFAQFKPSVFAPPPEM